MQTYTFNVAISTNTDGSIQYKQFVVEATNWSEARHQLNNLISAEKQNTQP